MRLRVAKKVLWSWDFGSFHRLSTIEAARLRVRRYVGPLPPAWDAIDSCARTQTRNTLLCRGRLEDFMAHVPARDPRDPTP